MNQSNEKVLLFDELVKKVAELKAAGKTVVQSHGIYDLIHPGIVMHLDDARKQGDVLVVTVIKDKDVRRGPGRPIFPEEMRALNAAALTQVDYVCIVDDEIPHNCVNLLRPNIFAKGVGGFRNRHGDVHEKLLTEEKGLYFDRIAIHETKGASFSASTVIKDFLDIYPEDTKKFLHGIAGKYGFESISARLNSLKDMKVLLIGDGIIDEYCYCTMMGRSSKANLVVNQFVAQEVFAGGAFAIANHIASFCDHVDLVTLLGNQDSREDFVAVNLKPNVRAKFFIRDDAPTVIKRRYIQQHNNQKLFEINHLNDVYVDDGLEREIVGHLEKVIGNYDVILISDFGHGFITKDIYGVVERSKVKFGVNTQTNGANTGYNLITKYHNPYFVCLDEGEVRLASQDRFGDIVNVAAKVARSINAGNMIVTLGKKGSMGIDKNGEVNITPIFSSKVVDTVGAGDAFFAYAAPCLASGMPLDLVSFIGNAVGALAVQIIGNKKSVEKYELLEFVHAILK